MLLDAPQVIGNVARCGLQAWIDAFRVDLVVFVNETTGLAMNRGCKQGSFLAFLTALFLLYDPFKRVNTANALRQCESFARIHFRGRCLDRQRCRRRSERLASRRRTPRLEAAAAV